MFKAMSSAAKSIFSGLLGSGSAGAMKVSASGPHIGGGTVVFNPYAPKKIIPPGKVGGR